MIRFKSRTYQLFFKYAKPYVLSNYQKPDLWYLHWSFEGILKRNYVHILYKQFIDGILIPTWKYIYSIYRVRAVFLISVSVSVFLLLELIVQCLFSFCCFSLALFIYVLMFRRFRRFLWPTTWAESLSIRIFHYWSLSIISISFHRRRWSPFPAYMFSHDWFIYFPSFYDVTLLLQSYQGESLFHSYISCHNCTGWCT